MDLGFLFLRESEEGLHVAKEGFLQLERHSVAYYLEESIVQTAFANIVDELRLGGFVVAIEC